MNDRKRKTQWLTGGTAFLISLALGCHWTRTFNDRGKALSKSAVFEGHAAQFDTLFIGSSRFVNGVIPSVFDKVVADEGVTIHSFNLAASGADLLESEEILERALTSPGAHIKYVIAEVLPRAFPWRQKVEVARVDCSKAGVPSPSRLLQVSVEALQDELEHLGKAAMKCFFHSFFAIGSLWNPVNEPTSEALRHKWLRSRGFEALKSKMSEHQFEKSLHSYTKKLAANFQPELSAEFLRRFRSIERIAKRSAAKVVWARFPTLRYDIPQARALPNDEFVLLADWGDPTEFPELYEARLYANSGHFTEEGAEIASTRLGEIFARWIKEEQSRFAQHD